MVLSSENAARPTETDRPYVKNAEKSSTEYTCTMFCRRADSNSFRPSLLASRRPKTSTSVKIRALPAQPSRACKEECQIIRSRWSQSQPNYNVPRNHCNALEATRTRKHQDSQRRTHPHGVRSRSLPQSRRSQGPQDPRNVESSPKTTS